MDPPFRKTCKRLNEIGHAHYLTFSCVRRRPFLTRDRTRHWAIDAIHLAREKHSFDLWAWVLMPEHMHLLVHPRNDAYDISDFLSTLKQSVAKRAVLFVREQAPDFARWMLDRQPNGRESLRFWQRGGGYDHNLWSARRIWDKSITFTPIRYVEDWWNGLKTGSGRAFGITIKRATPTGRCGLIVNRCRLLRTCE